MQITLSKHLPSGKAEIGSSGIPVIVLRSDKKIASHPFSKGLSSEDKAVIGRFLGATSFERSTGVYTLFLPSGKRLFILGVGDRKTFYFRKSVLLMRRIIATAKKEGVKTLEVNLADFVSKDNANLVQIAEAMATQFEMANFEFTIYKTPGPEGWNNVEQVTIFSERASNALTGAVVRGKTIGEEINAARSLANTPGGDMTPQLLAEAAKSAAANYGVKVAALDEKEMKRLGMGGILSVGQGSQTPPRLIVMEYMKGKKSEAPVVLIGKGITFDSGGLNLKPENHMNDMHLDMSGGAAVIHTITALARLKVKKNVVGLIPAAENMPSGGSYRPGDVVRTMNGKTIEILNTDAEGRVVLSDALEYSKKYKPRLVVDIATLTGAAMVALGQRASAVFATDRKLETLFRETGERYADYVWPLPLWEEYEDDVRATFGDWANVGKTRYGGAITGAVFLWQFIKPYPWVHIDIAPRMTSIDGDILAKGSAGASINLLTHLLEKY